jgi:hypothetical protein
VLPENLAISAGMTVLCVLIHAGGLATISNLLRTPHGRRLHGGRAHHVTVVLIGVVFGLLALHALEIFAYGALYMALGEFQNWETSIYFAASSFTTLGYGDVALDEPRRMIAAVESVVGLLLIGWSTAILVSVTSRISIIEAPKDQV